LLVAALGGTIALGRAPHGGVDLIDDLYSADMSSGSPLHWTFNIRESVLNGVGKRAIYAHPPSAIRWTVQVPRNARLQAAVGLEPGAWDLSADGVVFGISIEHDARRVDLLMRHVDPLHVPADRDWIPVDIDMSAYAGRRVSLVFRTEPSMSGVPANGRYDWALWGAPRIVTATRRPSRSGEGGSARPGFVTTSGRPFLAVKSQLPTHGSLDETGAIIEPPRFDCYPDAGT
jgi:hypothetical protein